MTDENAGQIEFWNSDHGLAWARHADSVDVMFAEITHEVLTTAEVGVGDRVLDLGCGSGGTTLVAADRVTAVGSVTAVDVSSPMIERAQQRADAAGIANVTFVLGDAATYPFADASFNKLISRLGAMFFDDPASAFARMGPALSPGGKVALGVWRGPSENLWAMEPVAAAKPFLETPPRPSPQDPGPFSFADPDRVRGVLAGSGWQDIDFAPLDFQIPLGRTMEAALAFVMEMGPLAAPFRTVSDKNRTKAIDAITDVLEDNTGYDGVVRLAGACWIVTGRAG